MHIIRGGADLNLLQKKVALHKAVTEEATGGPAILEEAGGVGPSPWVGPHQLTVMGNQDFGNLRTQSKQKIKRQNSYSI